ELCQERLARLQRDLDAIEDNSFSIAAVHVCPHRELLPRVPAGPVPVAKLKYAFARAYLGSPRFGERLAADERVRHVVCGHSHIARHFEENGRLWTNIGSTYTEKKFAAIDVA